MKSVIYNGSRKTRVDTGEDECLYSAPRPSRASAEVTHAGKDLYIHTDSRKQITYYLHLWTTAKDAQERIIPIAASTAERFLRAKGLTCNLFPKSDPVGRLYAWGYGIAEEF